MATTYEEIIGFLKEDEMGFHDLREDGKEGLVLNFVDSENDESPEIVFIKLDEEGGFIHFFEPQRYNIAGCKYKAEVFETLLVIQNETKMLQWEYDPSDGEIRACIELPLEDVALTKQLFIRCVLGLAKMMDIYHARIKQVIETGVDAGPVDPKARMVAELEAMLARLKADEGEAEGI